jgi:hypothetical protein
MRVVRMGPSEVQRCWPWLSRLLAPAVALEEGHRSLEQVREALEGGAMGLATLHAPMAAGVIVVHPAVFDDGQFRLWIPYFVGEVRRSPKAWLRLVRTTMGHFISEARSAGCADVRIAGRNWHRVFPDWEPIDGFDGGLRKVL